MRETADPGARARTLAGARWSAAVTAALVTALASVGTVHAQAAAPDGQEAPPQAPAAAPSPLPPPGLAALEAERSRSCVEVIARLQVVDADLAPMAARSQRLIRVAQAVALEERSFVDSLDVSDPLEAEVRDWFRTDLELAERYVAEGDEAIAQERAAAREAVKTRIAGALDAVQSEANERIGAEGDLMARAPRCDGALFIRSVVLEACETTQSPLCEAARSGETQARFRFVDRAEDLWDRHEFRPWTAPEPLQAGPDGQLGGARTMAASRTGNLLVTVVFAPLVQDREEITPEVAERLAAVDDSLGIESSHPDLAVAPSIAVRANLLGPLADESGYVLHFGTPESAEVLWSGPRPAEGPVQATAPLAAAHVGLLLSGQPIHFTAVRTSPDGPAQALYTVQLSAVNQVAATRALLGYMTEQLSADLARLVEPRSR